MAGHEAKSPKRAPSPTPAASLGSRPAKTTPPPPVYDTYSRAEPALKAAAESAERTGRRILVNFGTNDCAPCRLFNDAINRQPFRDAFLKQFITVFLDVSEGSSNTELLRSYGVDQSKGLPAIAIWDLVVDQTAPREVTRNGEIVDLARVGEGAIRDFLTKRFRAEKPGKPGPD